MTQSNQMKFRLHELPNYMIFSRHINFTIWDAYLYGMHDVNNLPLWGFLCIRDVGLVIK